MPIVTSESLMTQLRHGKIEPLYFLFGDEEFLIDEALEQIIDRAVDKSTVSFNFDLLHGTEVTLQEIVERASAYPLMADRRVVVVRDIDRTFSLRGKPDPTSPFVRYITSASCRVQHRTIHKRPTLRGALRNPRRMLKERAADGNELGRGAGVQMTELRRHAPVTTW